MPKAARKDKKKKDPNAPKRPLAPYMFFCKDRREDIKAENPDVSFGEIGKILGQEWSSMSDKEKRPYVQKAEKDKERYTAEMANYEPHSD
eukprot:jgi/Chlat1/9037/Chrsp94S08306